MSLAGQRQIESRGIQRIVQYPVAASQTILVGDFVTLNSSGLAQLGAATGGNDIAAVSGQTNKVIGRAVSPSTDSSNPVTTYFDHIDVMVWEPGTEFLISLYHTTPASAVTNTNLEGKSYGLINLAANAAAISTTLPWIGWGLDLTQTTSTQVFGKIVEFDLDTWPLYPHNTFANPGTTQYANVWIAPAYGNVVNYS